MNMSKNDNLSPELPEQVPTNVLDSRWESFEFDISGASHQGHVRENNEDSYLAVRFGRSLESLSTNLDKQLIEARYSLTGYGMMVADGIGGMDFGEVASRMALTELIELILETSDWTLALKRERDVQNVFRRMTQRFQQIDEALREQGKHYPELQGMGTTLTVAGILGNDLVIGHIGDSRAYLFRGSELSQLTTDHTLAQALIDAGVANRDDPAPRSMRHVLTAAIGSMGESIQPQVERFSLRSGDRLLLCTDGLTEMLDDETIASVLRDATSAQGACQTLIDFALGAGGVDNVTVVVACCA